MVDRSMPVNLERCFLVWVALHLGGWATQCEAGPGRPRWADIHYGPDQQQVFDLWTPQAATAAAPVVIIFHPGGFVGGDKHPCLQRLIEKLLDQGIAAGCANYRLAPQSTYPAPMLDGGRVIQWLRAHHAEYSTDRDRIAVAGLSAGGGIALWLAFHGDLADPTASDPVARESTRVVAVVTSNAQVTYDPATIERIFHTRKLPQFLAGLFGARSVDDLRDASRSREEQEASPTFYVHAGGPPVLAYYTSDEGPTLAPDSPPEAYIHHPAQGRYLEQVAQERGAQVTVHSGHYYAGGWEGFLDASVSFLAASFRRQ
jgi:acetyl esterase